MRFADRTRRLMDGMMGSEVRERMRVQIWWLGGGEGGKRRKKNSSSFPAELNLGLGCSTLPCLSSHRALCSGPQPSSRMASEAPPTPSTDVLAQPFPLPPLHLQLPFTSSSPSFGSRSLHRFLTFTLSFCLFF